MSTDEQATRASGSVPHAYGNALAWRWSREMPTPLRRGFLTLLYALRAMANSDGQLRFPDSPIRITDIAKAIGADEKDTRRYLAAAVEAGVLAVRGEQKRGKPTLYVLLLGPSPDWAAAVKSLEDSQRKRSERKPPPWRAAGKNGGRSPELSEPKFGGPPPELTAGTPLEVRGTAPRTSSGDHPPTSSGDRPLNNPGSTHVSTHDEGEVVLRPQVVGAPDDQDEIPHDEQPRADPAAEEPREFALCAGCRGPLIPDPQRPGRDRHAWCTTAERTAS
ncbi:hypothetical protein ABT160_02515 [Streptomyces sp. NPDC001941]|uniref:hypothetical protein n=1 Tax=Streptomyces sp. NPDC001941 TaxID=3154659 RepID=UPI003320AC36